MATEATENVERRKAGLLSELSEFSVNSVAVVFGI